MAEQLSNGTPAPVADVEMKEEAPLEESINAVPQAAQDPTDPNPPPQATSMDVDVPARQHELLSAIPAPVAAAIATPPAVSSATARPGSMPPQPSARPEKPVAHGGPTRQFLNSNITPHLLEGMKYLAVYEPEKPLLWLSEFLRDRSKEVEGS